MSRYLSCVLNPACAEVYNEKSWNKFSFFIFFIRTYFTFYFCIFKHNIAFIIDNMGSKLMTQHFCLVGAELLRLLSLQTLHSFTFLVFFSSLVSI